MAIKRNETKPSATQSITISIKEIIENSSQNFCEIRDQIMYDGDENERKKLH